MKALTLTQPWATAIAMGYKPDETRSWRTNYRGRLAIHAAKGFPKWAKEFAAEELAYGRLVNPLPVSVVLCTATLVDCVPTQERVLDISSLAKRYGDYSWGRWAWLLSDIEVLPRPIITKGALGLWEWDGCGEELLTRDELISQQPALI